MTLQSKLTEEQEEILERLIKYTYFKSMRQLKREIREYFHSRGWGEALRLFSLRQADAFTVNVYFKEDSHDPTKQAQ